MWNAACRYLQAAWYWWGDLCQPAHGQANAQGDAGQQDAQHRAHQPHHHQMPETNRDAGGQHARNAAWEKQHAADAGDRGDVAHRQIGVFQ